MNEKKINDYLMSQLNLFWTTISNKKKRGVGKKEIKIKIE